MTTSPGMANTGSMVGDNTGVGTGPGPLRHPRPLTAADLHLQLEKEQEAVVSDFPVLVCFADIPLRGMLLDLVSGYCTQILSWIPYD